MPYGRYSRYTGRRRRYRKSKASQMNSMQKNPYTFQKKKYTKVFDIIQIAGATSSTVVISHIGGGNTNSPEGAGPGTDTVTLGRVSNAGNIETDLSINQQFKITGVMWKLMFS